MVERFISTVSARDRQWVAPTPTLSGQKQTALKIGLQIEKLACAMDTEDFPMLAAMANRLHAAASECGITPIAELSAKLERKCAVDSPDRSELMELTLELLELCRSTYHSHLPATSDSVGGVSGRFQKEVQAPALSKVITSPVPAGST
jgi:hypothetical protein